MLFFENNTIYFDDFIYAYLIYYSRSFSDLNGDSYLMPHWHYANTYDSIYINNNK